MSETAENKSRFLYLDFLRIFAIFAVVVNHNVQSWRQAELIGSAQWWTDISYLGLIQWPTSVFLMVSGALFVNRSIPLKKLFGKYILRMVSAFLFWSAVYAVVFDPHSTIYGFIVNVVYGHYHLWFTYMIAGIYVTQPIYHRISKSKETAVYLILVSFIFMFAVPDAINLFRAISPATRLFGDLLEKSLGSMFINFSRGYGACFLLGWYLHENTLSPRMERWIYIFGMLAAVFITGATGWVSVTNHEVYSSLIGGNTAAAFLSGTGLFVVAKRLDPKVTLSDMQSRILRRVSKDCFGVYLVHELVMRYMASPFGLIRTNCGELFSNIIIPFLVFTISLCISDLINRIPVLNKYIV